MTSSSRARKRRPPAGNLEHAGLAALGVEDRADGEALEQRAPRDILGEFLDRHAGLDPPDIGLGERQAC